MKIETEDILLFIVFFLLSAFIIPMVMNPRPQLSGNQPGGARHHYVLA